MKKVTALFLVMLALSGLQALPSDKPVKKEVKQASAVQPAAKPSVKAPVFQWFGPIKQNGPGDKKDKC